MKKLSVLFLFLISISSCQQSNESISPGKPLKTEKPFSTEEYQNLPNFFSSKEDMLNFFDFRKGNVVGDIGAYNGIYERIFSLSTDSITFYSEDIDSVTLNRSDLDKSVKHYSIMKGSLQTNKFYLKIGTEKKTGLPDSIFDKIIMISTFHEFTSKDEMINDLRKKLKSHGRIYILETHCYTRSHTNVTVEETISLMKKHGFDLIKQQSPEAPETYCFIFEKK